MAWRLGQSHSDGAADQQDRQWPVSSAGTVLEMFCVAPISRIGTGADAYGIPTGGESDGGCPASGRRRQPALPLPAITPITVAAEESASPDDATESAPAGAPAPGVVEIEFKTARLHPTGAVDSVVVTAQMGRPA
ncbi:hypothetical protein GBZ26_11385 [Azospirillum formosense]|uniref:Uncharacterized protein n=1 Tax=Azospirillum formosense TaxID=861533 RepID=A0ABX2KY81_9PROT|nr:hypothetical protein [Azospirillum formosense]MBY3755522.1 hypothetical protein [Azospirillum formosense]NUB19814.1 hypothetical protein [Azospirillum formosense]